MICGSYKGRLWFTRSRLSLKTEGVSSAALESRDCYRGRLSAL